MGGDAPKIRELLAFRSWLLAFDVKTENSALSTGRIDASS